MNKILNGQDLAKAVISGANALNNAKNKIDALNVFPVPDGDTGTNMASTISSVIANLQKNSNATVEEVSKSIAHDMIYEARGNSGVILSQIFKGFALGCEGKQELDTNELIEAFEAATKRAYKSVFKPVEGTILTVIRETSENLRANLENKELTIVEFFESVVKFARKSCDETPNKLKTLREVGVTDSGGEGLFIVLNGMLSYFKGQPVEIKETSEDIQNFISDNEVFNGEFGYCTEVLIQLNDPKNFDKKYFTKGLQKIANSLVVVDDEEIVKVHGHTLQPGKLLNYAQKYGEFIKIKSENMTLQANNSKANADELSNKNKAQNRKKMAIISCNLGSGIIARMKELGCDYIVESGQTQNPSAQDLLKAIEAVNADNVFILPNNSNVILVAQQAAQVHRDSNVVIIPTKTQIQGITAMLNFNHSTSPEENIEMMQDAIEGVDTGEVTRAVRNTTLNNIKIKEGDFLAILNGKIVDSVDTANEAAQILISKMVKPSKEIISIYYGDEASVNEAEEISNFIEGKYDLEVEIVEGNQPNYNFFIGVE
ncbi:DAK2 domain-containing protein [Mycoplasmopsis gallopavonis]|uniref:Dihydroxyacetone (Glycerone) kinase, DhaK2 subunit n=1 Tax=Mycoplasmopsis gallopavonis TaxID=76629 RepID=A0A449AYT6_9BACT|nr:DAK2 domain-containing protein [Mycoplasmopsis gallopavonis]RIV16683.1 DAK2 domain-containing protein [Mycoplasmopsis gallopavonis]VEU72652.1 dihydroxyacetone (glycerone) kinase, DhaK2 subunit [Mycoplasmopsis gallopavonis]